MAHEFELPRIRCAICDKPVDVIEVWADIAHHHDLVVEVTCHGAKDRRRISQHALAELPADFLWGEGVAFDQAELPAPVKQIEGPK